MPHNAASKVSTSSMASISANGTTSGPQGMPGNDGPQGPQGPTGEVSSMDLNSAIGGTSANSNGVAQLGLTVSDPPTQTELQAVANKLDELIAALRRQAEGTSKFRVSREARLPTNNRQDLQFLFQRRSHSASETRSFEITLMQPRMSCVSSFSNTSIMRPCGSSKIQNRNVARSAASSALQRASTSASKSWAC